MDLHTISLCTGGGGLDIGLELAIPSARPVVVVEREAFACGHLVAAIEQGLMAPAPLWSDVRTFNGRPWRGVVDFVIGGIPCFAPDTVVLTDEGYRPIQELRIGDKVLTHLGRWRGITSIMCRDGAVYREIRAQGCAGIITTDEHPFFAVDRRGDGFSKAKWVEAHELTKRHRLAQVLPRVKRCRHSPDLLWFLGRFLADGWICDRKVTGAGNRVRSAQGRVIICCAKRERKEVEEKIARLGVAFNAQEERSVIKFYIADQRIWRLAKQFGRYAHGKLLPGWCLELEPESARSLLEGYISGDGCKSVRNGKTLHEIGSVSKGLAYGVALLVQRAYGIVAGVKSYTPKAEKIIEGRVVSQRQRWVVYWYESGNRSAYVDGAYGWKLVKSNKHCVGTGRVFNISVEEDESYVADGTIVHNCQPHSAAGKQLGEEDERDLWSDARRIIVQSGAWGVIIENVEGMLSSGGAARVVSDLQRLGFVVEGGLFSAAEVGAAHQRARVFIVAIHEKRLAHAGGAGLEGYGRHVDDGDKPGRVSAHAARSVGAGGGQVADAASVRCAKRSTIEPTERRSKPIKHRSRRVSEDGFSLADAGAGGRDGRSDIEERRPEGRALPEWTELASRPPGPLDVEQWRIVIDHAPHLAPSLSRVDAAEIARLLTIDALGAPGQEQEAQRELRRMADDVAARLDLARIEQVRMLGNGVVPLQAAYAIRACLSWLAARGVAAASELLVMETK